jgi:hypothetical protein
MDACEKISGEFVVARGNSAKVLEFIEEALDEVAFAVKREVASPRGLAVGLRGNHRGNLPLGKGVDQRIGIVGLVTDQSLWIDPRKQRLRASQGAVRDVVGIRSSVISDMMKLSDYAARSIV